MQRTPEFATLAGNTLIPANRFRPHPAVGETFCPSGHCIATLTEFQITASSSLSWGLHHRCYVRTNKGVQWSPGRVHRGEIQRRLWCLQVFKRNLTKHKPATMTILNWTQICLWLGFIRITILELCLFLIIVRFFTDQWSGRFIRERPACWEIQTQMTTRAILSSSLLRWAIYCQQRKRQRQRQR